MDVSLSPNPYLIETITIDRHPTADLVILEITERSGSRHVTVSRVVVGERFWQQIADRLAARGITPSEDTVVTEPCS